MASIGQSLAILRRAIPEDHPRYKYIPKAEDAVNRMAHITKQLYLLYGADSPTPYRLDLVKTVHNALGIMSDRAKKKKVTISTHLGQEPRWVRGNRSSIIQVLCNVLQNALDASTAHQRVVLTLHQDGHWWNLEITDQGSGIPEDVIPHVFDPFFTTKEVSREGRMGLGLAVSFRLLESMEGRLDFTTQIGQGTTFMIRLPNAEAIHSRKVEMHQ